MNAQLPLNFLTNPNPDAKVTPFGEAKQRPGTRLPRGQRLVAGGTRAQQLREARRRQAALVDLRHNQHYLNMAAVVSRLGEGVDRGRAFRNRRRITQGH